jgi:hypothetical protein
MTQSKKKKKNNSSYFEPFNKKFENIIEEIFINKPKIKSKNKTKKIKINHY